MSVDVTLMHGFCSTSCAVIELVEINWCLLFTLSNSKLQVIRSNTHTHTYTHPHTHTHNDCDCVKMAFDQDNTAPS